jgi:hypothetical protein
MKGLDMSLLSDFASFECLRKLCGLDQLPLGLTLQDKIELADQAVKYIIAEKIFYLFVGF